MNLEWKAVYDDGSYLKQYNAEGLERRYKDINREKLVRFDIIDKDSKKAILSVYFREGRRLIYRRRTLINVADGKRVIVFLVGWQQTFMTNAGPKNVTVINYIHEDGSISLDGARKNLELLNLEK